MLSDKEKLDYLVDLLNYQTRIIGAYQNGTRDKRFTPSQNAERLQELIAERDDLYQKELCLFARRCGYEYLPSPAVPHWQRAEGISGLQLTYAPPPTQVSDEEIQQVENGVCGFCESEGYYLVHLAFDPAESIYEICPICKGKGRLVTEEPNPQGDSMAESQVEQEPGSYLIIVQYNPDYDAWVVDEDSRHILEDNGGGYSPQELRVHTLRGLPQSVPWQYVPDEPQDDIPDERDEEASMSESQIELLANYIMAHCPREIGDEGAGDVAIRLMGRMADGIDRALHELGVPGEGYPAPIANAVDILQKSLGLWGEEG